MPQVKKWDQLRKTEKIKYDKKTPFLLFSCATFSPFSSQNPASSEIFDLKFRPLKEDGPIFPYLQSSEVTGSPLGTGDGEVPGVNKKVFFSCQNNQYISKSKHSGYTCKYPKSTLSDIAQFSLLFALNRVLMKS